MERQHYKVPTKIIFVRGNIFVNNKEPKSLFDIAAHANEKDIEKIEEIEIDHIDKIIEGDFTIDDNTETYDNEIYLASGEVYTKNLGKGLISQYYVITSYDYAIDDIVKLSKIKIDYKYENLQNKMLFANIYSAMEVFLQDILGMFLMKKQEYKEAFLLSNKDFSDYKFHFNEIYQKLKEVDYRLKNSIDNMIYHKLDKIQSIFESTFGIKFPDYKYINENLKVRHDIVHRNGAKKGEKEWQVIETEKLYELIDHMDLFVYSLFKEFEQLN